MVQIVLLYERSENESENSMGNISPGELPTMLEWLQKQELLTPDGVLMTYRDHHLEITASGRMRLVVFYETPE